MRKLSLHASALDNDEYKLYTSSLNDIAPAEDYGNNNGSSEEHDDEYYENFRIGIREVRAWLRGRYLHVAAAQLDLILKYFSPTLAHADTITGSQFFAALRLVVHAASGKQPDRALAFVQVHPSASIAAAAQPPAPPAPLPKNHGSKMARPLPDDPRPHVPAMENPFSTKPPDDPVQTARPVRSDAFTGPRSTHNPFARQLPGVRRLQDENPSLPPLPPRKASLSAFDDSQKPLLPPRQVSMPFARTTRTPSPPGLPGFAATRPSMTRPPFSKQHPPPIPLKPSSHVTSALMKQSLQASKAAQTLRKAEERLEKERIMQVLKSSSGGAGTNARDRSNSPLKLNRTRGTPSSSQTSRSNDASPPLPLRTLKPAVSPPVSSSSLEQVALAATHRPPPQHPHVVHSSPESQDGSARTGSRSVWDSPSTVNDTASTSPVRSGTKLPCGPPPKHPASSSRQQHVQHYSPDSHLSGLFEREPPQRANTMSFETSTGAKSFVMSNPSVKFSNADSAPTSRVTRSKSMHYSSSDPPLPSIGRRRPESIQIFGSENQGGVEVFDEMRSDAPPSASFRNMTISTPTAAGPQRRSSLSVASSSSSPSISSIQRTFATLQPKLEALQPHLDKMRYKAEAGLSRRGFLRDPSKGGAGEEESLMLEAKSAEDTRWAGGNVSRGDVLGQDSPDVDDEWIEDGDGATRLKRPVLEQDNLKWPAGEGWALL